MKKFICVALSLIMVLGMAVSAFAQDINSVHFNAISPININKLPEQFLETENLNGYNPSVYTVYYGYDANKKFVGNGFSENKTTYWYSEGRPIYDTSKIKYVIGYCEFAVDHPNYLFVESINLSIGNQPIAAKIPNQHSYEDTYLETVSYSITTIKDSSSILTISVPLEISESGAKSYNIFQKIILAILTLFGATTIVYFLSKIWNL